MARYVKEFGSPDGTGWMDWPAGLADRMLAALNVSQAFSLYTANRGHPKWVNANQHVFRVVTMVWKMRKESGEQWW